MNKNFNKYKDIYNRIYLYDDKKNNKVFWTKPLDSAGSEKDFIIKGPVTFNTEPTAFAFAKQMQETFKEEYNQDYEIFFIPYTGYKSNVYLLH